MDPLAGVALVTTPKICQTTQLGVWRDYYKANPEYLPSNEPDGIFGADCSSGTCECSAGYIDNGNGCEQMTEEQAATTLAPTTLAQTTLVTTKMTQTTSAAMTAAPTTTKADAHQPAEYTTSLLGKLDSVFEVNRPGKPRTHLMTKWKKLESKSVHRHNQMKSNGCEFADSFEFDGIDFDTVNVCLVSFFISRRIIAYY